MKLFTVLCLLMAVLAVSNGAPVNDPNPESSAVDGVTGDDVSSQPDVGQGEKSKQTDVNKETPPTVTANQGAKQTGASEVQPHSEQNQKTKDETEQAAQTSSSNQDKKPESPKQQSTLSVGQLARQLSSLFNTLTYDQLKLLNEQKNNPEGFEGVLQELLLENDKNDESNVFSLLDQLKGRFGIVGGMLSGAMFRKKPKEKPAVQNPPVVSQPDLNISQEEIKVSEDLKKALKDVPLKDLGRVYVLLKSNAKLDDQSSKVLKDVLNKLQSTSGPPLRQDLIDYAVSHPTVLKYTIEQIQENQEVEEEVDKITLHGNGSQETEPNINDTSKQLGVPPSEVSKDANGEATNEADDDATSENENNGDNGGEGTEEDIFNDLGEVDLDLMGNGDDGGDNEEENSNEDKTDKNSKENAGANVKIGVNMDDKPVIETASGSWFGMWHFLIIFLLIAGIVGVGYVCSHNRKRIREGVGAYVSDAASRGRRARNYRYKPVSST